MVADTEPSITKLFEADPGMEASIVQLLEASAENTDHSSSPGSPRMLLLLRQLMSQQLAVLCLALMVSQWPTVM